MYDQLYVDSLMEMVIYEDNIQDYKQNIDLLTEGPILDKVLKTYRLKKEDLSNPSKVKNAISHIEVENDRQRKKTKIMGLCLSILGLSGTNLSTLIGELSSNGGFIKPGNEFPDYDGAWKTPGDFDAAVHNYEKANKEYNDKINKISFIGCISSFAICVSALIALGFASWSDYDRLIKACEKEVHKIDKALDKLKRSNKDDNEIKKYINDLEKSRDGLNKSVETLRKAKTENTKKKELDKAEIRAAKSGRAVFKYQK